MSRVRVEGTPLGHGYRRVVEYELYARAGSAWWESYTLGPRGGQSNAFYGSDAESARHKAADLRAHARALDEVASRLDAHALAEPSRESGGSQ